MEKVMIDTCECCDSKNLSWYDNYKIYKHYRCRDCGYEKFLNDGNSIVSGIYEDDEGYNDDLLLTKNVDSLLLWNHKKAIHYISKNFSPNCKILDVGCFNGFFVKKLLDLDYDAYGVDFNNKAINFGITKFGLQNRLYAKNVKDLLQSDEKFDVVCLFEVIEHLEFSAADFLKEIMRLLNKDGILILSVPNASMLWRPKLDFPPHHFSRYTAESLMQLSSKICSDCSPLIYQQMSVFDLSRNFIGEKFFRNDNKESLRGGEFKYKQLSLLLRGFMNRTKRFFGYMLWPVDKVLYFLGFRYIGQVLIIRK